MKKIYSTTEYEINVADLENLIRKTYLTDLPENAKTSITPQYQSYYDDQVWRGVKITVEVKGD